MGVNEPHPSVLADQAVGVSPHSMPADVFYSVRTYRRVSLKCSHDLVSLPYYALCTVYRHIIYILLRSVDSVKELFNVHESQS